MDASDCPVISDDTQKGLFRTVFWLEGVTQTVLAILGITCNTLFSLILSKKELRNSFNILLIMLALFDSTYLLGAILESFRKSFHSATDLHLRLFPTLLYPMQGIALTGSIFMTVAIAFERYVAVHNPINYNRAMNDSRATRSRVLKFLIPVMLAAILFSLPKFFESAVVNVTDPATNVTVVKVTYTSFRVDLTYSRYVNWSKLLVQGVVPVVLLIFFNKKIYCDIKERQKRWRPFHPLVSPMAEESLVSRRSRHFSQQSSPVKKAGSTLSIPQLPHHHMQREMSSVHSRSNSPTPDSVSVLDRNAKRRRVEDRLALLFMGIVAVFILCSLPRLMLSIYETVVMERALECQRLKKPAFPAWVWVTTSLSHVFLVVNSSVNLLIYCLWNAQFRKVAQSALLGLCGLGRVLRRRRLMQEVRHDTVMYTSRRAAAECAVANASVANAAARRSSPDGVSCNGDGPMLPERQRQQPAAASQPSSPISSASSSSVVVIERANGIGHSADTAAHSCSSSNRVYLGLASKSACSVLSIARACADLREGPSRSSLKKAADAGGMGRNTRETRSTERKDKAKRLRFRETSI